MGPRRWQPKRAFDAPLELLQSPRQSPRVSKRLEESKDISESPTSYHKANNKRIALATISGRKTWDKSLLLQGNDGLLAGNDNVLNAVVKVGGRGNLLEMRHTSSRARVLENTLFPS